MEEWRTFVQHVADEICVVFQSIERRDLQELFEFLLGSWKADVELFYELVVRVGFGLFQLMGVEEMGGEYFASEFAVTLAGSIILILMINQRLAILIMTNLRIRTRIFFRVHLIQFTFLRARCIGIRFENSKALTIFPQLRLRILL